MPNKKETLYVVFGEYTERVEKFLNTQGYKVIGTDRTLDAAAIMARNLDEVPDTYLVLCTALVSGVVDVGINYDGSLIENLEKLRMAAPTSRLVLILPDVVEPRLCQEIVRMAIYDIFTASVVKYEMLPEYLSMRKNIADYPEFRSLPVPVTTIKHNVIVEDEEIIQKPGIFTIIWELIINFLNVIRGTLVRKEKDEPENNWSIPAHDEEEPIWEIPKSVEEPHNAERKDAARKSMPLDNIFPDAVAEEKNRSIQNLPVGKSDTGVDHLTGLLRREAIAGMVLTSAHSVLFADLNGFKKVNDKYGHVVGDRLLQEFANVAQRVVRKVDTVVRWGGDEFVILLTNSSRKSAMVTAERLRSQWAAGFLASRYKVGVAIGVSGAYNGGTLNEVVTMADAEMYKDKKKSSASTPWLFVIYGSTMTDELLRKVGKNGVLVDADIKMPLVASVSNKEAWKCDWRLGFRAAPMVLPFGVEFYGLTPELGNVLNDRDYEMVDDFLLALMAKKRVVVNVGEDARIVSGLSELGAVVLKV
jgi:diguanylate cyclase (GGDEF)-like protein